MQVHFHPFLEARDFVAPAGLPFAGDPRFHAQAPAVGHLTDGFHFVERQRPRPHQTHVPEHHVDQLRQFVDAELAQQGTKRKHPGITIQFEHRPIHVVAVILLDLG